MPTGSTAPIMSYGWPLLCPAAVRISANIRGERGNNLRKHCGTRCRSTISSTEVENAQDQVLEAIQGVGGRGQAGLNNEQLTLFDEAVKVLETYGGIQAPVASALLLGRWRLLFTTTPGTESPVQRTFTGVDAFQVFQDIVQGSKGIGVRNVVKFGEKIGALRVEAATSTDAQPIPGFVPRQGEGNPLLGKSSTSPPERKDMRLDFQFDRAGFKFRWPFQLKIPYPVPFRILGDERKGWLDITYLSSDGLFRLCRGNKGTLFVLKKVDRTAKEALLDGINEGARDDEVLELIDRLVRENPTVTPANNPLNEGKWRAIYTKQVTTASRLALFSGLFTQWQIIGSEFGADGRRTADNVVEFLPWLLKLRSKGLCKAISDDTCEVTIDSLSFEIPGKEFSVEIPNDGIGTVQSLYLDDDMKIVKGNKGGYFVMIKDT